ncbi:thioredoxin domain-containing protein 17-like [Panonychus citri]|uniref:thioredoxin domain-containing protein 17-like n=1 Tax=Panonychus citri TaxID=50023 RepID=UPI0023082E4E|nr:thioredoxin domain-containing protein 17-like [Panonychus citri]
MKRITVNSSDEMIKAIESVSSTCDKIWLLFTGSKDATGQSWCPDCVTAHPVIESCLSEYEKAHDGAEKVAFITVEIDRADHKNLNNYYRTNKDIQLKCVPTLMLHGQLNMRLAEDNLTDPDLIDELLTL